jgi:hypothetical protein
LLAILSRDWVTVLATLAAGAIFYLARPPQSAPAQRVDLKEGTGQVRSLSFQNDGGMLAATVLDETIRPWRVDAGRGQAAPWGLGPAGLRRAVLARRDDAGRRRRLEGRALRHGRR